MIKPNFFQLLTLAVLWLLDRLAKNLIILKLPDEGVLIFPGFSLKLFINPHLAFSLPLANWLAIILSAIVLTLAVIFLFKYLVHSELGRWGLGLLLIGSVSNLLDRFKYGGVIDWLNLWFLPSFNLSDLYILLACLFLFLAFKKIAAVKRKE